MVDTLVIGAGQAVETGSKLLVGEVGGILGGHCVGQLVAIAEPAQAQHVVRGYQGHVKEFGVGGPCRGPTAFHRQRRACP